MPAVTTEAHAQHSRKTILKAWWAASRPAFYIATFIPLLLGFVMASNATGTWRYGLFIMILLVSLFLHLAANLANDLFDHLAGTDTAETIGGSRALQAGAISLAAYKKALVLLYGSAFVLAAAGALYTGLHGVWGIVLFAMAVSYFYVAPPIRFGYRALGEVFVFLSMGVTMITGTYYVLTGVWSEKALAISVPVGLMVAGILYFQSLPEIETDKAAGKHTLANVLGSEWAERLFCLWWPLIWGFMIVLWLANISSWVVFMGIFASLPLHFKACKAIAEARKGGDWLALDAKGHLVRKMYLLCGVSLLAGIWL